MPFYQYMYLLGERLRQDRYDYSREVIFANSSYFKDCHKRGLSVYKALEFFHYHLNPLYQ